MPGEGLIGQIWVSGLGYRRTRHLAVLPDYVLYCSTKHKLCGQIMWIYISAMLLTDVSPQTLHLTLQSLKCLVFEVGIVIVIIS